MNNSRAGLSKKGDKEEKLRTVLMFLTYVFLEYLLGTYCTSDDDKEIRKRAFTQVKKKFFKITMSEQMRQNSLNQR